MLEKSGTKWLINRRTFAMPDNGTPNYLECDTAGNIYAACGDGLNVWNPAGTLIGKILISGGITGFCFGTSGEMFLLNENKFWILTVARTVKGALLERMGIQVDHPAEGAEGEDSDDSMESLFEE